MSRRAVALLFLAACGAKSPPTPAEPPPPAQFTWNWSPPCRVPIRIHIHVDSPEMDSVVGATLSLTSRGDEFLVEFPEWHEIEINGKDASGTSDPEKPAKTFVIDANGAFVRVEANIAPGDTSELMWGSWVGDWVGWSEKANLDDYGLAYLHKEHSIEGERFVEYIREIASSQGVQSLGDDVGGSLQLSSDSVVEPAGVRPHHATITNHLVVIVDGVTVQRADYLIETDFDWDHAEGCGP